MNSAGRNRPFGRRVLGSRSSSKKEWVKASNCIWKKQIYQIIIVPNEKMEAGSRKIMDEALRHKMMTLLFLLFFLLISTINKKAKNGNIMIEMF